MPLPTTAANPGTRRGEPASVANVLLGRTNTPITVTGITVDEGSAL